MCRRPSRRRPATIASLMRAYQKSNDIKASTFRSWCFCLVRTVRGSPPHLQLPERLERLDAAVGGLDGPGRERGGRLAVLQRRPRVALPAARQQRRRAVRVQQRTPRRAVQALQER